MGLEGRNARVDAVGLGGDITGGAVGAGTPVIERMGDVGDLLGFLGQAEEEVVILAAVVLGPLPAAGLFHQHLAERGQVADIVVGAEVVQHEVRLEVVEHHVLHLALKGRLVGIDEIGSLLHDRLRRVPQGTGVEDIVMIQQGDVIACSQLKTVVGVPGNALILGQFLVADAGVFLGAGLHMLAHGGVLPGVHTAELPVAVGLVDDGIQQLLEEIQRGVVQGHHNADLGACLAAGLVAGLLYQQLHRGKAVCPQGLAGEEDCILTAGTGLLPHALHAHGAQVMQEDEQRERVPDLAALADGIPHGPGQLPERGIGNVAQGLFQLLLVAAAEGKVTAKPLDQGGFLAAGALGPDHPVPQGVHLLLVALYHHQRGGHGAAGAEQSGLLGPALAAPAEITVIAPPGQLLGPGRHHGAVHTGQQHFLGQLLGQMAPHGVFHHQQVHRLCSLCRPLFRPDACPAQGLFQQVRLAVQHLGRGGARFFRDPLRQLTAALFLLLQFRFLVQLHSDFSNSHLMLQLYSIPNSAAFEKRFSAIPFGFQCSAVLVSGTASAASQRSRRCWNHCPRSSWRRRCSNAGGSHGSPSPARRQSPPRRTGSCPRRDHSRSRSSRGCHWRRCQNQSSNGSSQTG